VLLPWHVLFVSAAFLNGHYPKPKLLFTLKPLVVVGNVCIKRLKAMLLERLVHGKL
jgi:hypothetical protein